MKSEHKQWKKTAIGIAVALLVVAAFVIGRMTGSGRAPDVAHDEHAVEEGGSETAQMYTCSMHPSVRSPNPNDKCPICGMDLIPVPSDGDEEDDGELPRLRLSPRAVALMNIQTWPAERRAVEVPVRLFGRIEADETRLRTIAAWVPGRLDRLYVDSTGVEIEPGHPMVEIYSPRLIAAQEELLQARRGAEDLQRSGLGIIRETSEATLTAAREKLRLLGLAPGQIEQIERTGKVTDHLVIHAPVGGVVTERLTTQGAYVNTGDPIYRIADLSQVWVSLEAYESDLQWLQLGQEAVFTTEAFPGEQFTGQITFIQPILDQATRTVRVRLEAPNPDGRLKPGMFARGTVHARIGTPRPLPDHPEPQHSDSSPDVGVVLEPDLALHAHADHNDQSHAPHQDPVQPPPHEAEHEPHTDELPLLIPASAPLLTGRRAVVYVRLPGTERPTFEPRDVVLGPRAGDYYVVREGLAEGELVVTHGSFKIDSELQIRGRPSMMAPEGGAPPAHDHGSGSTAPIRERSPALEVTATFREALGPVYRHYLEAQTALAGDDLAGFVNATRQMHQAIETVPTGELSSVARSVWSGLAHRLRTQHERIGDLVDIEAARVLFETYSMAALDLLYRAGYPGKDGLQVAFCPMAMNDAGALWLQTGDQIHNPYFGAAMLRCGEVIERVKDANAIESDPTRARLPVTKEFLDALKPVYSAYFQAKQALASDDLPGFLTAVPRLAEAVESLSADGLEPELAEAWGVLAGRLVAAWELVEGMDDIEQARAAFEPWAEAAVELSQTFGHSDSAGQFVAYCPMAFDFRGASWLQSTSQINNPYFGASMLRCGSVTKELEANHNPQPPSHSL